MQKGPEDKISPSQNYHQFVWEKLPQPRLMLNYYSNTQLRASQTKQNSSFFEKQNQPSLSYGHSKLPYEGILDFSQTNKQWKFEQCYEIKTIPTSYNKII